MHRSDRHRFIGTARGLGIVLLTLMSVQTGYAQQLKTAAQARADMVQNYIVREGITNPAVVRAMGAVPRHEFVRPEDRKMSYVDIALPIGYKQTISPPFVVGYMTDTLDPQKTDKVLEIGTGSGYQAAVLAEIVDEVYSIEIVRGLGIEAGRRLKRLGYDNVTNKVGDGYLGWAEHAPFDKIIVTCSPEKVPQPLADQLKEGGKMIIPLGERYEQVFHLLEKKDGKLVQSRLIPTLFVPMTGAAENRREVLPDPDNPVVKNASFEYDENEDGLADSWHYQRQTRLITDDVASGKTAIEFTNDTPSQLAQALQGEAINGEVIGHIEVSLQAKYTDAKAGPSHKERPALRVFFYDRIRKQIGEAIVGPFTGTTDWKKHSLKMTVPEGTREMIFQVGLNGGTGRLLVDDIQLKTIPREEQK